MKLARIPIALVLPLVFCTGCLPPRAIVWNEAEALEDHFVTESGGDLYYVTGALDSEAINDSLQSSRISSVRLHLGHGEVVDGKRAKILLPAAGASYVQVDDRPPIATRHLTHLDLRTQRGRFERWLGFGLVAAAGVSLGIAAARESSDNSGRPFDWSMFARYASVGVALGSPLLNQTDVTDNTVLFSYRKEW